jgi:hypothetical protein
VRFKGTVSNAQVRSEDFKQTREGFRMQVLTLWRNGCVSTDTFDTATTMQQAALEERERERISYPHRTPRKRAASKTPKGAAAAATAQLLWQRELAADAAPASDAPSPQLARLQPSSSASKKNSPAAAARSDRVR